MAISPNEQKVLDRAARILAREAKERPYSMTSPQLVRDFLRFRLEHVEHEQFCALFLDSQHRLIEFAELFRGTLDSASVYPREVAKEALHHNAAAVIFAHNHPSGIAEPSMADRKITKRLQEALGLFEIRVLDHIVVGSPGMVSFAEEGLI
ncbi:MAG: JAB domain-containing protein [Pseudomonadota bacterium]